MQDGKSLFPALLVFLIVIGISAIRAGEPDAALLTLFFGAILVFEKLVTVHHAHPVYPRIYPQGKAESGSGAAALKQLLSSCKNQNKAKFRFFSGEVNPRGDFGLVFG